MGLRSQPRGVSVSYISRICTKCGRAFAACSQGQSVCESCRVALRSSTLATRVCRTCGARFPGGPRAWYCPACRKERNAAAGVAYRRRKAQGLTEPIGSLRKCAVCGEAFAINSARQIYCKRCAAAAVAAIDRAQSRERQERLGNPHSRPVRACVICGKAIAYGRMAYTCGDDCARKLKSYYQAVADYRRGRRKSPPPPLGQEIATNG